MSPVRVGRAQDCARRAASARRTAPPASRTPARPGCPRYPLAGVERGRKMRLDSVETADKENNLLVYPDVIRIRIFIMG